MINTNTNMFPAWPAPDAWDSDSPIIRRHGACLPHWTRSGGIYAVTFRLADALPKAVLQRLIFERWNIKETAGRMNRPLSLIERKRLDQLFSARIEDQLDRGHGRCWLGLEPVAKMLAETLSYFQGTRYRQFAWSIMPNHVHVVVRPLGNHRLSEILHSWKSYSAKEANRLLKRSGPFWQAEPYDHLIRDEEDFMHAVEYAFLNPVRAGLKNWKWVWIDEELRPLIRAD